VLKAACRPGLLRSAICTASSADSGLFQQRVDARLRLAAAGIVARPDHVFLACATGWRIDCVKSRRPAKKLAQPPSRAADSTASVSARRVKGAVFMVIASMPGMAMLALTGAVVSRLRFTQVSAPAPDFADAIVGLAPVLQRFVAPALILF